MLVGERAWKVGDRIRATTVGTVIEVDPGDNMPVRILLGDGREAVWLNRFFESVFLGQTVKVGDKTRLSGGTVAEVVGIHGDKVWVCNGLADFRKYETYALGGLVPIPADSE